jgi:hypothetical protein
MYTRAREASAACDRLIWWDSPVASMAGNMGMYAQSYVRLCRDAHENYLGLATANQLAFIEEHRLACRGLLASFLLIDPEMVDAPGTIRPDGLDADIARLCDVPALQ